MRKTALIVLCAALLAVAGPARAADVVVDFDINLPEILILSCYSGFTVDISTDNLTSALGLSSDSFQVSGSPSVSVAGVGDPMVATFGVPGSPITTPADLANMPLNFVNLCAIRAIGGSTHSISTSTSFATGAHWTNDTSSIGLVSATATPASTIPTGLASPIAVNVDTVLDMTGAALDGTYDGASITVTAELS